MIEITFKYSDNTEKTYKGMTSIIGVKVKGTRPVLATVTSDKDVELWTEKDKELFRNFLAKDVYPALHPVDGQIQLDERLMKCMIPASSVKPMIFHYKD